MIMSHLYYTQAYLWN